MLPPPPPSPRPLFPRRRSRAFVRSPVVGLGLSFGGASLSFPEDDAPLSPHHVYPDTLRRTPGAPLFAKEAAQESAAGTSYFHLPADIMSPAHDGRGQQAFGLGILDLGRQTGVQQPFPVLL
ncbi:hypothetical protein BN946_scf184883.g9 [Trametes cinnabarina]|uniref:Uncharacterized protein n=1 Tax=Pycnoporus cinnabarinus TaxID=5643 RepID=A0A060SLZ8_PYCCI|nr:hypothetical protein BN946_scf184883.g9 [Trametes cinnabarina]